MNAGSNNIMPDAGTLQTLIEIARRHGTPTYAFDVQSLRAQVKQLITQLPADVDVFYSLKANASLGICDVFADCGIGADVASAGELATARAAGFGPDRIFVAGPFKLPETVAQLRAIPEAIVSVDSPSELQWLCEQQLENRAVIRLRPDYGSSAAVAAGSESRFGFTAEDLQPCRGFQADCSVDIVGFHVFSGSQMLHADGVIDHLRRAFELSNRAADVLNITPELFNLGGGFGIPYGPSDDELDLDPIAEELGRICDEAATTRIMLELGRYLVARAGWYLTRIVGHQTNQDRPAVIVDGGTHQRADMCGLCLRSKAHPPLALNAASTPLAPTDVLGCLSLPADVLAEAAMLPPLSRGGLLAFANAGAYGLWSSPAMFHGSGLPAEVAFDGQTIHTMRQRQTAQSILDSQEHIVGAKAVVHS